MNSPTTSFPDWQSRTQLLVGKLGLEQLHKSHVLIVGLGGVGGAAAEMLARAGVGELTLVDADVVQPSNINRQLIATHPCIGKEKVNLWAERLQQISPELILHTHCTFIIPEMVQEFCAGGHFDFVVDAIDTLTPKVYLITALQRLGIPFVSSMGAGGRLDPTQVRIDRLDKVFNCKLARTLRKRLKKQQASLKFQVVWSAEHPLEGSTIEVEGEKNKKSTSGTISYLPATFGCFLASVVIRYLIAPNPPLNQPQQEYDEKDY